MQRTIMTRVAATVALGATLPALAQVYTTTSIVPQSNLRIQNADYCAFTYPTGPQTYAGVPFDLPLAGNNAWIASNGNTVLEVNVNVVGASAVHTLINNTWGQAGPNSYARIEFYGQGGSYHRKDLIGNVDIRDYAQGSWTNAINGTTTVNAFTSPAGCTSRSTRLDKQRTDLPPAFEHDTLTRIVFTDTGASNFQRIFVHGVTVEQACPTIGSMPAEVGCGGESATFTAQVSGSRPMTFAWSREGVPIDPLVNPSAATATLQLGPQQVGDDARYTLAATNICGTVSAHAYVMVEPADVGESGGVRGRDGLRDNNDFIAFINLFFALDVAADLGTLGGLPGRDGAFDNNDFIAFIDAFFADCG